MTDAREAAKRLARTSLVTLSRFSGALSRAESRLNHKLVILCYHRILPAAQKRHYFSDDLVVTPDSFRRHCAVLRDRFTVMTLDRACRHLRERRSTPRPLAVITFDDGYRDNILHAAPILQEFDLPGTFFIIAGLINSDRRPWYDELGQLVAAASNSGKYQTRLRETISSTWSDHVPDAAPPAVKPGDTVSAKDIVEQTKQLAPDQRAAFVAALRDTIGLEQEIASEDLIMTTDQLRSLRAAGHEIGSHSLTHEILPRLDDAELTREVNESKSVLEQHLGSNVNSFCYPNGDHDERVVNTVRSAGFEWATSVVTGPNAHDDLVDKPFSLRRRFVHEGRLSGISTGTTTTLVRAELSGLSDTLFRRGR